MTRTNGWPRREWHQAEPLGLDLGATSHCADNIDEPFAAPTPQDALRVAGMVRGHTPIATLLKVAGQHWDVDGYSDGDAEWLTPLVTQAAADRSD